MSLPCTGSIFMLPAAHTSMLSLMSACTMRRDAFSFAASPNVQPSTALMPENAEFMSNLLQREPMKLLSTSTVPIISSSFFTLSKCLFSFADNEPMENDSESGALVSSHTPGSCIVAPHATVQPSTRSSPTISPMSSSGMPFCRVTITPSVARNSFMYVTTSLFCCCLVMRKMMSYLPLISCGVYAVTCWVKFTVPVTRAPFFCSASMCTLLRFISSMLPPFFVMYAPRIVPNDPAPYIAALMCWLDCYPAKV